MVREIDRVADSTDDGLALVVGVDYDTVSIGAYRFRGEELEHFARLFVSACWAAGYNKARMEEDARDAMP